MPGRLLARDGWPLALAGSDAVLARLDAHLGLALTSVLPRDVCARWSAAVLAARAAWNVDFDGDQFALGRAF
ncbi:MAG: hypothetical protein ACMG6S_36570, partial [Byssovorax sp.]